MNKINIFSKYPLIAIFIISIVIFLFGRAILSLIIAVFVVLLMYLAVQIFGSRN